jgi:D-aminopeptidase
VTAGRARARDIGVTPGTLAPGPANAITDVAGVRVGHATVIEGSDIRTGVTAIVHDVLVGRDPDGRRTLPAGLSVFNGFGKMVGSTQIAELGTIETPVLLTSTLSVFRAADALLSYLHELPLHAGVSTLNPVVAETNDGYLSDIWARPVTPRHVRAALDAAAGGPVPEGCVGAGTGTGALGFKAGIGTSSRRITLAGGASVTIGAIVQANFGGVLTVSGVPVPPPPDPADPPGPAQSTRSATSRESTASGASRGTRPRDGSGPADGGNSCVIVLATDALLDSRQLERVASRAFAGMARTGSDFAGHSGDYALAFSTAAGRAPAGPDGPVTAKDLDVLFTAAIEATEEAILNSIFTAETTAGHLGHVRRAVPLDYVQALVSGRSAGRTGT